MKWNNIEYDQYKIKFYGDRMVIKIKSYKITSNCCPYQVECKTYDGRIVYIRSRHDHFYVGIGKTLDEAVAGKRLIERDYDVYGMENIIKETKGVLDFSKARKIRTVL